MEWPQLKGLQLADPDYAANDSIELPFGAEVCSIILQGGLRKGGPQAPIAQKTQLGWILSGGCDQVTNSAQRHSPQCTSDHESANPVHRSTADHADGQLADDDGPRFPRGANALLRHDCYVDDVVTGAHYKDDAIALQVELRNLCMAGGFSLRKWAANCQD